MKVCAQSFSLSSLVTTGTRFVTGRTMLVQHDWVAQPAVGSSWNEARRAPASSSGAYCNQPLRSLAQDNPPRRIGWRAPVLRTALTSESMPAVCQPAGVAQPLRQQSQLIPCGLLTRAERTAGAGLKAWATELQKAGA